MEREPIELEPTPGDFAPRTDPRPRIPEPLPVRLVSVEDVRLPASAGLERQLDEFYVDLLRFERDPDDPHRISYRADNFHLHFDIHEGLIHRETVRPLGIEIPSLSAVEHVLAEREIEYTRQKGLAPGQQLLTLPDPAGNWVELFEMRSL